MNSFSLPYLFLQGDGKFSEYKKENGDEGPQSAIKRCFPGFVNGSYPASGVMYVAGVLTKPGNCHPEVSSQQLMKEATTQLCTFL